MQDFKTCDLVDELSRRNGVQEIFIEPYNKLELLVNKKEQNLDVLSGPARVLIIYD